MDEYPQFLGINPCRDLWFRDGNIVLACDSVSFRVNESVLSIHSPVFRDMLSMASSAGDDTYESCPVIRMSDEAHHLKLLLKMMYNRSYGQDKRMFSLEELRGLLRLSSKYLINHIRSEIIAHLLILFPTSISDYRSVSRRMGLPSTFNPLVAVDISREFDIPIILPAALYMSSRLSVADIVRYAFADDDGSNGARDDVLLFADALQRHLRRDVFASAWFPILNDCPADVDNTSACSGFGGDHTLQLAAHYLEPSTDIFAGVSGYPVFEPPDPCVRCIEERVKIDRDAYQPLLWGLLPVLCPRRGWHGWMNVKEAQVKAMQPWTTQP